MKQIKLKENSIKLGSHDYLSDYLVTLGINPSCVNSFINSPALCDIDNPLDLNNMENGIKLIKQLADENRKFFIQVDSDVDGFTSSTIFYQYFKEIYPQLDIQYRLQDGKEHGITLDTIPNDREVIIIPDAGSMQLEEQKILSEEGKYVIILDHHEVLKEEVYKNVLIINNQNSPKFSNKNLSGAGIVFMFIKAFDERYENGIKYTKYMDLAALGIIADMMDTRTLGNNYIIYYGLKNITNKIFQEILTYNSYSISDIANPTKIDVAFYVAPLINGLIRSGSTEEKENFFKAMIDNNNNDLVTSTTRGRSRTETIYQIAVRQAANAKSRQDSAKKKSVEFLNAKIKREKLDENKIIVVPISVNEEDNINQNITGLAAMELVKTYNKPVLILREKIDENGNATYSGSGRSKEYDGFNSLLQFILDSGDAIYAEGHNLAFGTSFTKDGLNKFISYANNKLANIDFNKDFVEVDYWFKDAVIPQVLTDFARGVRLYGNGIPQPKFAFTFNIDSSDLYFLGANKDTIKFVKDDIDFIMFKQPKIARQLQDGLKFKITCVGRSQINSFGGRDKTQVVIDSCDIETVTLTSALDLI
jgi:single-stranded-DNA-specific exonuclease